MKPVPDITETRVTFCHHIRITETGLDSRDDRLTHWRCLDCGDTFPLIGDTDRWRSKALLPPCVNCGHPLYAHDLVNLTPAAQPDARGLTIYSFAHSGPCACGRCQCYEEDKLPLVSHLLGNDVRRVTLAYERRGGAALAAPRSLL